MTDPDAQQCARCRFFEGRPPLGTGICRRYPPQKVEYPYAQWPEVYPHDWCGEFQEGEEKIDG